MNSLMLHVDTEKEGLKNRVHYLEECKVNVLHLGDNNLDIALFCTIEQLKQLEKCIHDYVKKEGKKHD